MLRAVILLSLGLVCMAKVNPPQVTVYAYKPINEGEKNFLLCHAKEFSPPNIKLQLMQGGQEIPKTNHSDISFEKTWKFKLTTFVEFYPRREEEYSCRVEHNGNVFTVKLESF